MTKDRTVVVYNECTKEIELRLMRGSQIVYFEKITEQALGAVDDYKKDVFSFEKR